MYDRAGSNIKIIINYLEQLRDEGLSFLEEYWQAGILGPQSYLKKQEHVRESPSLHSRPLRFLKFISFRKI
jgi:hypothetical protein